MEKIIIDEEFRALLPELDNDTYAMLEANLLQNGCRDSIVLWGDILIDGHNRYEICTKHGIEFNTVSKEFGSREEALIWIISTQVSRRNLTQIQLSHFRGLHYMADRKLNGRPNGHSSEKPGQNDHISNDIPGSTSNRLASRYRVSSKTIRRDAKTAAAIEAIGEISPPAKKLILSGEVAVDKSKLGALAESPKEEIRAVAASIENGTYKRREPAPEKAPAPETPIDIIFAAMRPFPKAIDKLLESFSALSQVESTADRERIKNELRLYIIRLDNLYGRV